ncbi:MAG: exodeoxyribonuclease VII small subunit, partial [Oscillospiraceae bacterium]|nr:exodeoxyribonuclease VII small subunit [Oscillospiraceae bacterium]
GEVSLEESVELYKEAADIAAACRKLLDEAELKIAKISRDFSSVEEEEG